MGEWQSRRCRVTLTAVVAVETIEMVLVLVVFDLALIHLLLVSPIDHLPGCVPARKLDLSCVCGSGREEEEQEEEEEERERKGKGEGE